MATYADFMRCLEKYRTHYRRDDIPPFEVQGFYDLLPASPLPASLPRAVSGTWPKDEFVLGKRRGVYAVFSESLELLYVGKASLNSSIGNRLGIHFRKNEDGSLRYAKKWTQVPRFVVAIAVPDTLRWEAPALEEFLIMALQPLVNGTGFNSSILPGC